MIAPWRAVNYVNPPFNRMEDFLAKGALEVTPGAGCVDAQPCPPRTRYGAAHCISDALRQCGSRRTCALRSQFSCRYVWGIFPTVRGVQVLSETVAFEGYRTRLPHALALLHMGDAPPSNDSELRLGRHSVLRLAAGNRGFGLLSVPAAATLDGVRSMVIGLGYRECYVLRGALSQEQDFVSKCRRNPAWSLAALSDTLSGGGVAVLLPARFENRCVQSVPFHDVRAREWDDSGPHTGASQCGRH